MLLYPQSVLTRSEEHRRWILAVLPLGILTSRQRRGRQIFTVSGKGSSKTFQSPGQQMPERKNYCTTIKPLQDDVTFGEYWKNESVLTVCARIKSIMQADGTDTAFAGSNSRDVPLTCEALAADQWRSAQMKISSSAVGRWGALAAAAVVLSSCVVVAETDPGPRPDGPRICTREYDPVCARRGDRTRTFGNACEARASGFRIIRDGECRRAGGDEPRFCTREYRPVCARRGDRIRTFGNACTARADGYRVIAPGEC